MATSEDFLNIGDIDDTSNTQTRTFDFMIETRAVAPSFSR